MGYRGAQFKDFLPLLRAFFYFVGLQQKIFYDERKGYALIVMFKKFHEQFGAEF